MNDIYLFSLCSPDARFPKRRDWYLRINKERLSQLSNVFDSVRSTLDLKFGYNRHFFNQHTGEPTSDMAKIFHPSVLSGFWITTALDLFNKYGEIFIGKSGQMFPARPDSFIIHSEKSSPVMEFPKTDVNEYITILQWAGGKHFYLESSIGRIFSKPKYNTFSEAYDEAVKIVDPSKITTDSAKVGKKFLDI
jgi:hypothetical protein